ncbi:hypothetical protein NQ317_014166 [Molorchus minor]|uniref:Uncharacterized protein n=1 Tax=Molorchus minor TaxID=1323400 RepID=A0ABQ9IY68_9CUCU|nr:hypothetical protein NQ317_014166 [Molorchus minor]
MVTVLHLMLIKSGILQHNYRCYDKDKFPEIIVNVDRSAQYCNDIFNDVDNPEYPAGITACCKESDFCNDKALEFQLPNTGSGSVYLTSLEIAASIVIPTLVVCIIIGAVYFCHTTHQRRGMHHHLRPVKIVWKHRIIQF